MKSVFAEKRRVRLNPKDYRRLRLEVLERDRWRCQVCGSPKRLQVHHIESRGQLGGDLETNLVALCAECHSKAHC